MSRARKCDICGKLYEDYDTTVKGFLCLERTSINSIMFIRKDLENAYNKNTTIDCCKECMRSILSHIAKLKENNNG